MEVGKSRMAYTLIRVQTVYRLMVVAVVTLDAVSE